MYGARITAIGTYVPKKTLTNFELENMVETTNNWIIQRTGIQERRISQPDEFTSDLCICATNDLMHRYDKKVEDVDMVIVATSTPDFSFPSVSSIIQDKLKISNTGAIDISAACAGFVYALHTAHTYISSGFHKKILVIGADTLSKITDYTDRSTCILFGDGAGAVLVEREDTTKSFIAFDLGSDGKEAQNIYRTGLSRKLHGIELTDTQYLIQNGREVFRWVVRNVPSSIKKIMDKAEINLNQVDWFIPHSANLRMIEPICEKLGYPIEKTLYSLVKFGNTSAATIPLALDLGLREGKVKNGHRVLLHGFGSGLVYAGQLLELNFDKQINTPTSL